MSSAPSASPGQLPTGQSDILDEVYGTGGEVKDTVAEIHQYAATSSGDSIDPLNKLISNGLGFLIDYITPAKEALEMVTGNPEALNAAAANYNKISDETNKLGQELHDELKTGFGNWQGDASDAAHKQLAVFLDGVHGTAQLSAYISEALQASAVLMAAAKEIIIGIIADFVEQMLITWAIGLAGSILTLGASDAAATAATVVEAATTVAKTGEEVSKVSKLIEKVASIIQKIIKVIEKIAKLLEKIGAKIEKMGGKIGTLAEKVTGKGGKIGEMVGGKLGGLAEQAGEVSKGVGTASEKVGKFAEAAKSGDKASVVHGIEQGLDYARKGKEKFDEGHDKFDEYKQTYDDLTGKGDSSTSQDSSPHWKVPETEHKGFGDIAKDKVKEAGSSVFENEQAIFTEGADAGAFPTKSSSDINNELGVTGGGQGGGHGAGPGGGTWSNEQDKATLNRQLDEQANRH